MSRRGVKTRSDNTVGPLDGDLRELVGDCIARAFQRVRVQIGQVLEPFGLRQVTFSALSIIPNAPGLNQAALADAMFVERPNGVAIVDELETAGLLRRQRSVTDRRSSALHLAEAGRAIWFARLGRSKTAMWRGTDVSTP